LLKAELFSYFIAVPYSTGVLPSSMAAVEPSGWGVYGQLILKNLCSQSMLFLRERSGGWSAIKIVAFTGTVLPALWIAAQAVTGSLGARPVTEAIHQCGDWALRLLFITLAVTPAQRILRYPRLIVCRRTLGVASAMYAVLHFSLYILDQHFDFFKVASEIVLRIYLTIGFLCLAGLSALAVTSTDAMVRRLTAKRWHALHRLVYVIAPLATAHFFMQSKLDEYQPVLMAGFLVWLLGYRVLLKRTGEVGPLAVLLLGCVAAVNTALGEALFYLLTTGVDARLILLAHFASDMEIRPAWWVLAAGIVVAIAGAWRYRAPRQRERARRITSAAFSEATQVQSGS
jgi:sulfoxide reductase heme-binding subunit YedZ